MYNIYQHGSILSRTKYTIDKEKKIVKSEEHDLTFDFEGCDGWHLTGGLSCIFRTGRYCTIWGGDDSMFKTGGNCTFHTGEFCTFHTSGHCTFICEAYATINASSSCTFKVGRHSVIHAYSDCVFEIGHTCIIRLYDLKTHKFTLTYHEYDDTSTILDTRDGQRYLLNKELLTFIKLMN